ncbi:TlpA family protein disulfide reductase [Pinibacter soli]|uniref:TlpA disulfide reductase family protein n=1 Tax=Pinibacter soli TaxID=3044211 RepID=A0ABT6RE03_9BACT|nr:TlpA disulfide reductase family protein [Pinibacter soli]MDI3320631.1 TlpA disulfide reductase family protein [Pinibacter soli]
MRLLTLLLFLFTLCFKGFSQTNITLILTAGKEVAKVYAMDISQKEKLTSTYRDTVNLNFTKTSNIDLYNIGCYVGKRQFWDQIWLDSGNIEIHAHLDSTTFKIDTVINSRFFNYVANFHAKYDDYFTRNDTIQINRFLLDRIDANIDNPFSLWIAMYYLNLNQNSKGKVDLLMQTLAKQGDKFSWFSCFPVVKGRIKSVLSTDRLNISDFDFIGKQNTKTFLTLNKADYYVLDFWFLGCAPCRAEHKIIAKKYNQLLAKNIEVIGIATDEYCKQWEKYLSANKYDWPNYLQASKNKITEALKVSGTPYYVVINSNGDIIGRFNSFMEVLKKFNLNI